MDISQLDKKMLIHVGCEICVIGVVTFWLNSKINGKDAIIEKQEKEIKDLQERLRKIELFLQSATGGAPQPSPPSKKKKKKESPTASEEEEFHTSEDHELEI